MFKCLNHITINTGNNRETPKSEVPQHIIDTLLPWVEEMLNGNIKAIFEDKYVCRISNILHNSICEFIISKIDDMFKTTDIIRFVVCDDNKYKELAWEMIEGKGNPIDVPFCAVELIQKNINASDFLQLPLLANFESTIAWAWLEFKNKTN